MLTKRNRLKRLSKDDLVSMILYLEKETESLNDSIGNLQRLCSKLAYALDKGDR